jgi:hypothetical protein
MALERTLKFIGAMVAICGLLFGVWKYFQDLEISSKKPYLEKQIALYFDATSAVATLASSKDAAKITDAEERFWALYLGALVMVEDHTVEKVMVKIGNCLRYDCPQSELKPLSLELAKACRTSLGDSWKVEQDTLGPRDENAVNTK